jgi:hypothetical protein
MSANCARALEVHQPLARFTSGQLSVVAGRAPQEIVFVSSHV